MRTLKDAAVGETVIVSKLMGAGAGGGGFLIFYVQPEYKENVRDAMSGLLHIPFEFENGGTRVIYYSPEDYVPRDNIV